APGAMQQHATCSPTTGSSHPSRIAFRSIARRRLTRSSTSIPRMRWGSCSNTAATDSVFRDVPQRAAAECGEHDASLRVLERTVWEVGDAEHIVAGTHVLPLGDL